MSKCQRIKCLPPHSAKLPRILRKLCLLFIFANILGSWSLIKNHVLCANAFNIKSTFIIKNEGILFCLHKIHISEDLCTLSTKIERQVN